jgi:hypothetical protein
MSALPLLLSRQASARGDPEKEGGPKVVGLKARSPKGAARSSVPSRGFGAMREEKSYLNTGTESLIPRRMGEV